MQRLGVLRDDAAVLANDFLPNAFARDPRSPTGAKLALSLDSACTAAYSYSDEVPLLSPASGGPLRDHLLSRKAELRAALRLRDSTPLAPFFAARMLQRSHN